MRCIDCELYGANDNTGLCTECEQERIELGERIPYRRPTREEQLQHFADMGMDTWDEYNDWSYDDDDF